jgi:hypothetical protein
MFYDYFSAVFKAPPMALPKAKKKKTPIGTF